jgi:hypothetical protein
MHQCCSATPRPSSSGRETGQLSCPASRQTYLAKFYAFMEFLYTLRSNNYPRLRTVVEVSEPQAASHSSGQQSRCIDWLRAGRPWGRSSSAGWGKIFLLSTSTRPVLGPTQPPNQWVPEGTSTGVKRQGREADQSPPTTVEVKNMSSRRSA